MQATRSALWAWSGGRRLTGGLWLRFLSGADIDSPGLTNAEIIEAAADAVQ